MATAATSMETLDDLFDRIGHVPFGRVRLQPPPGTATEADVLAAMSRPKKQLCELIDGVLVEKVMGVLESFLAGLLLQYINDFLEEEGLGAAFAPDGPFRILPGQVRLPDVSVFRWESLPGQELPKKKVPNVVPDLAVEVVSEGNTKGEIRRKLKEYFLAGVKQVWIIYPKKKSAEIYTSPDKRKRINPDQSLTGGDILPGFVLPLKKLFGRMKKPKKGK